MYSGKREHHRVAGGLIPVLTEEPKCDVRPVQVGCQRRDGRSDWLCPFQLTCCVPSQQASAGSV